MLEPPRNTGAVVPASVPGMANTPMFASISGQPSSGLMIWPGFQPGAGIMPTSPAQNASQSLASSPSAGAELARSKASLKDSSPAIDSGESSVPTHWSPSWVAMSPPCSQTNDITACQFRAGR